jgi:hypothetical protein
MIKVQKLRWPLVGLAAVIFVASSLNPPATLGMSMVLSNGQYSITGGTEPWALSLAILIILSYFVLMYAEPSENRIPLRGVFRRFVAFWLDFMIAMMATGPIAGILPVLVEWRRTGIFEWTLDRNTPAPGDLLLSWAGFVLAVAALIAYFAWPLVRRRPSPGACIVGYQIVPDAGTYLNLGQAILRTLLGFVATCAAYLAPFVARDKKKGKFWLDKVFRTHAVRL